MIEILEACLLRYLYIGACIYPMNPWIGIGIETIVVLGIFGYVISKFKRKTKK